MIGRYLFAIPFMVFGVMHFMNGNEMGGFVPEWIPGGVFWVYLTGVALIAAPVALLANKQARLAMLLLAAMLLIFVLTIHLPMAMNEETMKMAMPSLLKDLSLAGGALILAGSSGGDSA